MALTTSALGLCLLIVLLATLWPTPLDRGFASTIQKFLDVLHRNGIPNWFGYNKLEFSANVLLFVPLGFLFAMLMPARVWWLALVICPALSISIELTQGALLTARFATITDVMSNSIGGIIGILLAVVLRSIIHARDQLLIERVLWLERAGR